MTFLMAFMNKNVGNIFFFSEQNKKKTEKLVEIKFNKKKYRKIR